MGATLSSSACCCSDSRFPADRKRRVLLTGASGLLGRQAMKRLREDPDYEVRGLCFSRPSEHLVCADLLKEGEIERQLIDFAPEVVLHLAAERRPDMVHQHAEASQRLNCGLTQGLAEACRKHNAWMVYISTDYVFDGTSPPYDTSAKPQPLSEYGEQKLEGERIMLECSPKFAVLRIPLLYGPMEYMKESGVTTVYAELEKGVTSADHSQKRYPLYTCDLANVLRQMTYVNFNQHPLSGIYHWQSDECLTKYDMMQEIAGLLQMDTSMLAPVLDPPRHPRPEDTRMDCTRLEKELSIDPADYRTSFKDGIRECFTSFFATGIYNKLDDNLKASITRQDIEARISGTQFIDSATIRSLLDKDQINVDDYAELLKTRS